MLPYDITLYTLTHRGNPGDIQFYLRACRGAKSILELGCGYGRILTQLLLAGHSVTGMDLDPRMLQVAIRTLQEQGLLQTSQQVSFSEHRLIPLSDSLHLIQGDFRDFSLSQSFERILLPFNTLYCMLTQEDTEKAFQNVYKHLKPGGRFCFDIYAVDERDLEEYINDEPDFITTIYEQNRQIFVFEKRVWHQDTQRLDATYYYHTHEKPDSPAHNREPAQHSSQELETEITYQEGYSSEASKVEMYRIPQRYLLLEQVKELLTKTGFILEHLYGDFDEEPFDLDHSPSMIFIAQKPHSAKG